MGQFKNYYAYINEEAGSLFSDFKDEMMEAVYEGNNHVRDFFDEHVHQWVENDMCSCDLLDHAEILDQSENVESDWGLWEGMKDPRKAIESQAFFTYRNELLEAVLDVAKTFLEELEETMSQKVENIEEEIDGLRDRLHELQEDYESLDEEDPEAQAVKELDIEQSITETESDIMLAEERLDETNDKLNCIQESIQECC